MNNPLFNHILIFTFCLSISFLNGQNHVFKLKSDSLLYEDHLKLALEALKTEKAPSETSKKMYLETIMEYRRVFKDSLFSIIRNSVDSLLNHPVVDEDTRKVYLNHFLSSFSRRVFENELRIQYSDQGLSFTKDSTFLPHFLLHKGATLAAQGNHDGAIKLLEEAESICLNFDHADENMLAKTLFFLGSSHKEWPESKIGIGYNYLQKAERAFIENEHPDTAYLSQVYGMLSDIAWDRRDNEKGLNYVKKYKLLHNSISPRVFEDPTQKAENKFHFYYKEMQFYVESQKEEALKLVREAEKDFPQYRNNKEIKLRMAAIYNFMGEMYIRDDPASSVPYYKKAIRTYGNKNSAYHLQYLFNVGKASLYSGNALESLNYSKELIELASSTKNPNLPFFYFLQAFAHIKLNDFENALDITKKVVALMGAESRVDLETHEGIRSFESTIAISTNINLLTRMGLEFLNGFDGSDRSKNIANALYQIGIYEYGKTFRSGKVTAYTKSMYEDLVWGILETKEFLKEGDLEISELIDFSENTNDKYLWAKHKSKTDNSLFFDKELLEEESVARDELTNLKKQALADSSYALEAMIIDVELKLDRIENQKRGSNSSYYMFEEINFKLDSLQSRLDESTMILKYEYIKDSLFLFSIFKDSIEVNRVENSNLVSRLAQESQSLLANPNSDVDELIVKLEKLSTLLLSDINPRIENLVIKGSGILNLIPFDVLRYKDKFLIETFDISYIQVLGLYDQSPVSKQVQKALLVAPSYTEAVVDEDLLAVRGDEYNLAGALQEVTLISNLFPSKTMVEEKALKTSFKKIAERYDLLHLSMHSLINDKDPDLSNLAFHDGVSDNKLYINELYGMRLQAHLAVLSACSTALGKEKLGSGIISLSRAFTFAGVPSIVASLWDAPDNATKSIMVDFYSNLNNGKSKSRAMRNAKLNYLEGQELSKFKHPFYWAGFVVQGDTSPIEFKRKSYVPKVILLLSALTLFLGGYLWSQKTKISSKST